MINIHNNEFFEIFFFKSGEPHIKWKDMYGFFRVVGSHGYVKRDVIQLLARLNNAQDLMSLLCITNAIRNYDNDINIAVTIPFIPGGRQDRVANIGDPFTLKMYADIINAQNYVSIDTVDCHSDVTSAVINNLHMRPIHDRLYSLVNGREYDTIIIPDAGAAKKTFSYYFPDNTFNKNLNFVQCLKKRDTVTGKLSGFRVLDEIKPGAKCLIVDDIIDGAGTFVGLATEIKQIQLNCSLALYGTHGIFSKGIKFLYEYFDELYTTNSWATKEQYKEWHFVKTQPDYPQPTEYYDNWNNFTVLEIFFEEIKK